MKEEMTYDEVQALYRYDPETGKLFHRVGRPAVRGHAPVMPGQEVTHGDGICAKLHILIWLHQTGCLPCEEIDHIDGDRTNNRMDNLREATHQQNMCNRKIAKHNTSGYPGVQPANGGPKWRAVITHKGKHIHLGVFVEKEDAIAARIAAEARYHGDFAPTARNLSDFSINGA